MKDKTIEQRVRELGCGTAHVPTICTYQTECPNYSDRCKPDTCKTISKYYRRINRP